MAGPLVTNRPFVIATTILFFLGVIQGLNLHFSKDPRIIDGSISFDQMYMRETVLLAAAIVTVLMLYWSVLAHARKSGKSGWRYEVLYFFPVMFVYAWRQSWKGKQD